MRDQRILTSTIEQYDVVIVGAGPAGALLAYLLARSGASVLLVERDASFKRDFRGPAYQPSTLHLFNKMGILDEVLSIPHTSLDEFSLTYKGKKLFSLSLSFLPSPFRYAIAMEQEPLLKKLITLAGEFPNFTFVGDAALTDLIKENGEVKGVKFERGGIEHLAKCRLVVGADGRFSTVREKAGICMHPEEAAFDLVWFDLPKEEGRSYTLGLELGEKGILVTVPGEEELRIGWLIEKGGYSDIVKAGIPAFKEQIAEVDPTLKKPLEAGLSDLRALSLLDVKVATAEHFSKPGVILIGDSAHTASPIGAQGNKLAIEDAVELHPVIMESLKRPTNTLPESAFESYIQKRALEVRKIFLRQKRMEQLLFALKGGRFQTLKRRVANIFAPLFMRALFKPFAMGFNEVQVKSDLFSSDRGPLEWQCYHLLKIKEIVKETPDTTSILFSIPKNLKKLYAFLPGQFVTLRLLDRGQLLRRCYSISSLPEDPFLRITVKRKPDGLFSKDLIDTGKVGESLLVLPPAGQFTPATYANRHYFLAGGSGITPILPMIRSLLQQNEENQIELFYASHSKENIIFENELLALQKRFSKRFTPTFYLTERDGKPSEENILNSLPALHPRAAYYLCGPDGLMHIGLIAMKRAGIPLNQIHTEIYTSLLSPFEKTLQEKRPLVVGEGDVDDSWPKSCEVRLRGKEHRISLFQNETLLAAAIRQNLAPPYSCLEGVCATCIARLTQGKVIMPSYNALSEVDREEGKILTCQARPLTASCKIEYPV